MTLGFFGVNKSSPNFQRVGHDLHLNISAGRLGGSFAQKQDGGVSRPFEDKSYKGVKELGVTVLRYDRLNNYSTFSILLKGFIKFKFCTDQVFKT